MGRHRRRREVRDFVPASGWRRYNDPRRVQLHAGATSQLSRRRAERWYLARTTEQRRDRLRRKRPGESRWARGRPDSGGRPSSLAQAIPAAARYRGVQERLMASTETREATRPRASDRAATARPPDRDTAPCTPGRDMALKPVVIENVKPQVDHGRFAIKRTAGETVIVEAGARRELALSDELLELMNASPNRNFATTSEPLGVVVEPERARFSAWYELFPRSCGPATRGHGTFADCEAELPRLAAMGFDILYLP